MLPKEHRLRMEMDIKRLFSKGRSVFDQFVGVKTMKNGKDVSQFAVIVGTKVHKRAYKRHRIRRRIRGTLRVNLPRFANGFDVAVIAKPESLSATAMELEASVLEALSRSGILQKTPTAP